MKKLLCPLCGEMPKFVTKDIDEIEVCQILCECGLATEVNEYWLLPKGDPEEDELRAWKNWKKLVSKFPPFLRVHQGDNLKLDFEDDILTVIGKDTDRGKLYLENCRGDVEIATPDDVDQWPWELKQKGGDE
ncbi:hypothetical protein [Akkermansia muciniphila]|uniref:hypothetical protein n=1 Tax=Akkermansia muciniphila TaxID=239935 RepID=UPI001177645A|nr:hypothetical protein [Akkermansia muciniphila]